MVSSGARNLAKTVAQNETIAHAQAHAESLRKGTIQTRWHEQDWQKMSTRAAANANATGGVLAPETAAALLNGTQVRFGRCTFTLGWRWGVGWDAAVWRWEG